MAKQTNDVRGLHPRQANTMPLLYKLRLKDQHVISQGHRIINANNHRSVSAGFLAISTPKFTARYYAKAQSIPSCVVCLVSVTFVYCVETAKDTATVAVECEQEVAPNKLSNGRSHFQLP